MITLGIFGGLCSLPDQLSRNVQVIVRVTLAALCGSDVHLYTGKDDVPGPGTVMGHEFMGVVSSVRRLNRMPSPAQRLQPARGSPLPSTPNLPWPTARLAAPCSCCRRAIE